MAIEELKIKLDPGAFFPQRGYDTDAGLDLRAMWLQTIPPRGSAAFDTGVHLEIPAGYYGKIESRSGLNVKHGIVSCGGVIDCSYRGSIVVKLYNMTDEPYLVEPGDKIAQLVIMACETPKLVAVDSLSDTERGSNGFGSTGK